MYYLVTPSLISKKDIYFAKEYDNLRGKLDFENDNFDKVFCSILLYTFLLTWYIINVNIIFYLLQAFFIGNFY